MFRSVIYFGNTKNPARREFENWIDASDFVDEVIESLEGATGGTVEELFNGSWILCETKPILE